LFIKEKSPPLTARFSLQKPSVLTDPKLLSLPLYFAEEFYRLGNKALGTPTTLEY